MVTTTQARQTYVRQKTDMSDGFPTLHRSARPRADSSLQEETPTIAQNPAVWTIIGVLASSWIEYTRRTSALGGQQQWQVEWLSWAAMFIVASVVLFVQSSATDDAAGRTASLQPDQFMLGHLNVLIVALMNGVTRPLFLQHDLCYALVRPSVT